VKKMTGSPSIIEYIPYEKAYEQGFEDMRRRVPDLTKIRETVGYEPKVTLDQLLERVIAHFKS